MKVFKNVVQWLPAQFRAHPVRSLLIAIPALALVAAGILWAAGVFSAETFSYLPNRDYILAETERAEPQTLEELLHSSAPSVDTLLKNPAIAAELSRAGQLIDIVDSRLALNNLRSLDQQLSEQLDEFQQTEQAVALSMAQPGSGPAAAPLAAKPGGLTVARLSSAPPSSVSGGLVATQLSAPQALQRQIETLTGLQAVTEKLLTPPAYDDLVALASTMNMKGVWQSPDEALVHMIPSGDWLPEQGYKLYRVVNGESALIKEQFASPADGLAGTLGITDADMIQALYKQAALTPQKLAALGMADEKEFRDTVYRADTLSQKPRVGGELDFLEMKSALITIPAGIEQRIPETDLLLGLPIYVLGRPNNGLYTSAAMKSWVLEKFSVIQSGAETGVDTLKSLPGGNAKFELAQEILTARQQLATLSFVDDEYAEAADFLIRDDLSGLNLPNGAKVTYLVESPDGAKSSLSITRGTENNLTKPQGLMGYGIDGKVPLRWQQAQSPEERSIVSGYLIERRLDGESGFTQITQQPIAVSYMLDETGVYFESPVFFEDTVANDRTAEYRIRAIDVFGRTSDYSDTFSLKVKKVTPPNAPAVEPPVLSDDAGNASAAVQNAIALNAGKRGVVLPVFTDSPDTVRFTVYRAVAIGANGFGQPEPIANLTYDNPMAKAPARATSLSASAAPKFIQEKNPATIQKKLNKAQQVMLANVFGSHPNLIYFDADIQAGCTYKYWISAWDSQNNESAWSQSAIAGVPSEDQPEIPGALHIAMHARELPDRSAEPPGILHEDLISFEELQKETGLPKRSYAADIVTGTIKNAEAEGVGIGTFLSGASMPAVIDKMYDNLPEDRYIHVFLAVRGEDVLPDGTARLKWPAYAGEGLEGYAVYSPAFTLKPLEEMQRLSRSELTQMGLWRRINTQAIKQNQLVVGGLDKTPGSLSLFLICLEPEEAPKITMPVTPIGTAAALDITSRFAGIPEGGYVYIDWEAPDDPQVAYYRVYRSEVPSFKEQIDETALQWTLMGDHITAPSYTERVEQSFAHYYYYKVTSVSPWGIESAVGAVEHFRVPSTKPPQTPNLLLPLSTKDGVQVNFSAVSHCDRYVVYRTRIPAIPQALLETFLKQNPNLFAALFETPSKEDAFLTGMLSKAVKPGYSAATPGAPVNPLSKFKTLMQSSGADILGNLTSLGDSSGLSAYNQILDEFGPLALADYRDLSVEMMKRVNWVQVGELPVSDGAAETADPATGLLKPLSITDTTAEYGVMYLYTVQAWNDDNLGSSRPEPVEATPRRSGPFNPIDGLTGEFKNNKPHIAWNVAKMPHLTPEQCREDTVGYIVYRSDKQDGAYYQASPLLFETQWTDENADPSAFNWYQVKVLDTGGYLSEFSQPLLVRRSFTPKLNTVIPQLPSQDMIAPALTIKDSFSIEEGTAFHAAYTLTGTEPITITVQASDRAGAPVSGFSADAASRTVSAPGSLSPGMYRVTLTAKNSAGESAAKFLLEVQPKGARTPPDIAPREDGYRFKMARQFDFTVQLSALGSEPLTWSLEPVSERMTVPAQASIDNTGLLTIAGGIPAGSYSFVVKAANDMGFDTQEIYLEAVASSLLPGKPAFSGGLDKSDAFALTPAPSSKPTPSPKPAPSSKPAASPTPPSGTGAAKTHLDRVKCMSFTLTDVNLYASPLGGSGSSGAALLDIGYDAPVPVSLLHAAIEKKGNQYVMTAGTVYLTEPFELTGIGVTLVSLDLSPLADKSVVNGYVKSIIENQNLMGDMYALEFTGAQLKPGGIVVKNGLPSIRYEQFTIHDIGELWIRLNGKQTAAKDFISLADSGISMKSHLETLDNEGIEFDQAALLTFDMQGNMSGTIYTWDEQCLQLLVPGGAALRVEAASLTFLNGIVQPTGDLSGKLVLPFERHDVYGPGVPAVYAGHPETNEMDQLAARNPISSPLRTVLHAGLLKFGETVQRNGLLILPEDFALQDKCASVPIDIDHWDGKGFLIEEASMTPARVTERSLETGQQRTQAVVVSPTAVTVDLDRENFLSKEGGSETPNETEKPFWVGLVMKGGMLTLPPDFISSKEGKPIDFTLAPGEMIYDLNGFNYQTYLYNTGGVPAQFGKELGSFKDVLVYDCMLDLYANRVNLEVNAEVAVDLLLKNRVKVKLYTNQEDNEDGKAGAFLCSVAPTAIENAVAEGIDIKIDGGWVKPDGMHISGAMTLQIAEIKTDGPLAFTDMIVPADIRDTSQEKNPDRKYAAVELDKPANIDFQGFTMEVRAFDLEYKQSTLLSAYFKRVWLTLHGATLLAETIPLSTDTADRVVVSCPAFLNPPSVVYEQSRSVLNATFDDCIDVSGVLVPKLTQSSEAAKNMSRAGNGAAAPMLLSAAGLPQSGPPNIVPLDTANVNPQEGLIEFDTDQLQLTYLKQLEYLPVRSETRFGFDMEKNRCYFAVGLTPDGSGNPISSGAGKIRNFTGMVAYNMIVGRDNQSRYQFPDNPDQNTMKGFIEGLQVNKEDAPSFAAGIRGEMVVLGLCEIRDLYFGFESGPIVYAGGSLYLPLDVSAMVGVGDYANVGSASIIYNHPDRYFSFSMTINEINLAVAKVSGSLGFEYSPRLFGVYLGYPETLSGNFAIYHVGMGFGFRIDQDGDSMIQAKIELGFERDINVSIVYLKGYLYAGADGAYYFGDSDRISFELYLKGGVNGGIKLGSKRYNIIGFYLDARGKLESTQPYKAWDLKASCKVSYSLDLWVASIEGSVQASFDTRIT